MEKWRVYEQVKQCLRILEFADECTLNAEDKAVVKEAVCEYFSAEVVDNVFAKLDQKSRH